MTARTPLVRRRLGALLAVLTVVVPIWAGDASGQAVERSVAVSPGSGLVDGQYIAITFEGFPAGEDVRARQCPATAKRQTQCKPDGQSLRESGLTRVNAQGAGGLSLIVRAGEILNAEGDPFLCNVEKACNLVVFELDQNTGEELGLERSASAPLSFARSTVACPKPKGAGRVAGAGGTGPAASMVEWQAETCGRPLGLRTSYIVTNSPSSKDAYVDGLSDSSYAVSSIGLSPTEEEELAAADREPVQIPVSIGSVSFAYNYWEDFNRCDSDTVRENVTTLRFTASTLALIITGRLSNMSDERIAADNPHLVDRTFVRDNGACVKSTRLPGRIIKPVGRADRAGATWTLSSWMLANAKDDWESAGDEFRNGPTEIFPSYNFVDLRTGSAAVARQVKTFDGGQGIGDVPDAMWIGFVDTSVARQLGLPSIAVRNAAGEYVAPSDASVLAALEAATVDDDGVVTPNYTATEPSGQYPLLSVGYLITDKRSLTDAQAATMRAFAAYAITDGQQTASDRGYAPMPPEMQAKAAASVEQIEGTGGDGGGGDGGGGGSGPGNAPGGSALGDEADEADEADAPLDRYTVERLAAVRGGGFIGGSSGGAAPADGPLTDGGLSSQALGPAGGPAGVVRALTVFLGVPMLLALGIGAILAGRLLGALSEPGGLAVAFVPARLRWRRAT